MLIHKEESNMIFSLFRLIVCFKTLVLCIGLSFLTNLTPKIAQEKYLPNLKSILKVKTVTDRMIETLVFIDNQHKTTFNEL